MLYKANKNKFGFYSASPLPSMKELEKYYSEKYYQMEQGSFRHSYTNDEFKYFEIEAKIAEAIFNKINRHNEKKIFKLLDVGVGEGFFAKYFYENDWSVITSDFSDDGIMRHNPNLIDTLVKGDIFEMLENQIKSNKTKLMISSI